MDAISRAKARTERMTIRKISLGEREADLSPVVGPEALSLVHRLTRTSYGLAGVSGPTYERASIPCQFVPWHAR